MDYGFNHGEETIYCSEACMDEDHDGAEPDILEEGEPNGNIGRTSKR